MIIIRQWKKLIDSDNGLLTARCHIKMWICINLISFFDDVFFIKVTRLMICYKGAWAPSCMQQVTCQMPPPPRKGLALLKENWSTAFNLRGYWFYETLSTKKKLVCYGIVWFSVTTQASKFFTFNASRML